LGEHYSPFGKTTYITKFEKDVNTEPQELIIYQLRYKNHFGETEIVWSTGVSNELLEVTVGQKV